MEEPDEHTSLPAAIKGARRRAGLSQVEAAKRLSELAPRGKTITQRGWQNWELGINSAIERVPDIEKALDLDAGYFVAQLTVLERLLTFEARLQRLDDNMDELKKTMRDILGALRLKSPSDDS